MSNQLLMDDTASQLFNLVCNSSASAVIGFIGAHPTVPVDLQNDKGDTPLIMAARRGEGEVVEALLSAGASVHTRNLKGSNPLIAAAMKGHATLCKLFLNHGADVNQSTDSFDTALSLAIWQNHTDVCLLLMDAGANVNNIDKFGDTMLLDAAKHGNVAVMKKLLEKSLIPIDHANKKGDTALIRAAWKGEIEALQLLLDHGTNTGIANSQGCTALLMAAIYNHRKCFMALLEHSDLSVLNAVDDSGNNALFYLASFSPLPPVNQSSTTQTQREEPFWSGMVACIDRGCSLDTPPSMGSLLLCRAANNGRLDVARSLLVRGVDVSFCDVNNKSRPALLAHLQSQADPEMVTLLLDAGANIDVQDSDGNTALILAVRQNLIEIVELLLARNASLELETNKGETALSLCAVQHGGTNSKLLSLLTEKTAVQLGWNALLLHAASHGDSLKIHEFILQSQNTSNSKDIGNEIDLNYTDVNGRSALMLASKQGSLACVKLLLEAGVNIHITDREGCTALITAIRAGQKEIAETLARWQHGEQMSGNGGGKSASGVSGGVAHQELENVTRFLLRLGVKLSHHLDGASTTRHAESEAKT